MGWIILAEDGQPGRRARRLQPERSMGTVAVVMLEVDRKELLQMPAPAALGARGPAAERCCSLVGGRPRRPLDQVGGRLTRKLPGQRR
jgi:hypothetical protein